jgi:hypothetical protein
MIGRKHEVADHEAGPLHANPRINSRRAADFSLDHHITTISKFYSQRRSICQK